MINFAEKRRFMYRKKIPFDINCGVKIAMEVIGGKWKSCIIQELDKGPKRPSELHRYFDDASPRVINQQLKELEIHGMIQKKDFFGTSSPYRIIPLQSKVEHCFPLLNN